MFPLGCTNSVDKGGSYVRCGDSDVVAVIEVEVGVVYGLVCRGCLPYVELPVRPVTFPDDFPTDPRRLGFHEVELRLTDAGIKWFTDGSGTVWAYTSRDTAQAAPRTADALATFIAGTPAGAHRG